MEPLIGILEWGAAVVAGAFVTGIAFRSGWMAVNLASRILEFRDDRDESVPDPAMDEIVGVQFSDVDERQGPFGAAQRSQPAGRRRRIVRFGEFEVNLPARELRSNGLCVRIQRQPFALLEALLESPGEVVSREELRTRLWPADENVEFDLSINAAVRKVRIALRDSAAHPKYVETLPQLGYRFIAPLRSAIEVANHQTTCRRGDVPLVVGLFQRRRRAVE